MRGRPRIAGGAAGLWTVCAVACAGLGCTDMLGLTAPTLKRSDPATGGEALVSVGEWESDLPALSVGRALHTATLAPSGDVVLWGGCPRASDPPIEVVQPRPLCPDGPECWSVLVEEGPSPCLFGHASLLDARGRVVAAGGFSKDQPGPLGAMAWYDPLRGTAATFELGAGAGYWTATALGDGRELFRGGVVNLVSLAGTPLHVVRSDFDEDGELVPPPGAVLVACEEAGPGCPEARAFHAATLLGDGSVLVTGGVTEKLAGQTTAERFLPDSGAFVEVSPMSVGRWLHAAVRLADGRVLVTGGVGPGAETGMPSVEIFDPSKGSFDPAPDMNVPRWGHTATLLGDGRVLVAGGSGIASAEVYDPAQHTWTPTPPMRDARYFHTATRLPDGSVLVAGGQYGATLLPLPSEGALDSLELFVVRRE